LRGELPKQSPGWRFYLSHNKATPLGVLAAGLLLAGGAAFQQAGLIYTTAGNAGFITGLYVVLIPILSLLIWRRAPASVIWIAAALSALGLYLLSTGGALRLNWGDGLVLVSAFFWALHVLLVGWIVTQMDALAFAVGQYLMCGLVSLALGFSFETSTLQGILQNWWSVAYTGILSVGLGYTLQVVAQRFAPPADTAIILSMEAVFAALSGWLILDERLAPLQLGGCAIMLAGMLLAQSDVLAKRSRLSSASGAVDE
jgi:drug/metabolite transporter (DMT)-like permease